MPVDMNLVKLAVDTYKGRPEKYSVAESSEAMRQALIEINGGEKLDYKKMRNGASNGLFELIEEIIPRTALEGLQGNEFFMNLVEYRNVAAGDSPVFEVEDANWYEVSNIAHGVRGLRRQRLHGVTTTTVNPEMHGIRIYEPLRMLLAGRVDFNKFIDDVGKSYQQGVMNDIYTCFSGVTAEDIGGTSFFPAAGTYDEEQLLDVIAHVEATSGKDAIVVGTSKALRKLAPSIQGVESKSDLYKTGYYGNFYGHATVALPQRHKVGTTDFIFPDDTIHVIATESKPIKFVTEGSSIIKLTDAMDNADMTQEYEFYDAYGLAFVTGGNDGIGRYQFT